MFGIKLQGYVDYNKAAKARAARKAAEQAKLVDWEALRQANREDKLIDRGLWWPY